MLNVISDDPSTMTAAAIRKWSHPLSREAAVLADVFDLEYAKSGAKNRKPYARPWDDIAKRTRRGNAAGRTGAQVVALLRPSASGQDRPAWN